MNPRNLVDKVYESYKTSVIPLIEKGDYSEASLKVKNLYFHIYERYREVIASVKMGASYIITLEILLDKLEKGEKEDIAIAMKSFELFYAQTQVTKPDPSLN